MEDLRASGSALPMDVAFYSLEDICMDTLNYADETNSIVIKTALISKLNKIIKLLKNK